MDGLTQQSTSSKPASEKRRNFWNVLLAIAVIAMFLPFLVGLFLPSR